MSVYMSASLAVHPQCLCLRLQELLSVNLSWLCREGEERGGDRRAGRWGRSGV